MAPEGCQHCWSIWSVNARVPFVNAAWLVKRPVSCVENVGKPGEVHDEAIAIPGISVRAKAASFITLSFVGNIHQLAWFLGE
ncbi:Uncharacterised protein [Salmonella enterica subsp. enterica serovar Bovismorbificans]|uniref:Uncharacterized protein n=3 Tax=Salmonella enterica I TaxID=59201 RepID=G5R747_SALSE|nr:hypothetical protein SeKA_A3283 [Salmonella enterica subsp. enterica serovar Kentucky str. CVM29188]EDZ31373.1 hypothetical protein SeW_A4107 [Salmonella enterica subsp. enterica serovar Weltevreden str. HI_N05-537]EGE31754.1 hypothetical protein SD3246_3922 [Salmonella enterica subsp. enterica serovar Dublin str. SD3246]EHC80948.1 hypothetical protein LTSESEN_5542 [Salmonella enterica subsp. enterica serovar Senftenberg str. A4-543]KSB84650.1 hypothetical protein LFZ32_10100 [Salmonella ent